MIKIGDGPIVHRGHGDQLLGEHVETVHRHAHRLDAARRHLACQDRLVEQIGQRLRDEPALALLADEMPGPADTLQAARDVARRFDLADEIDGAHVDAEFQRCCRHDGAEPAFLQSLLRLLAHFQSNAAVVRAASRVRVRRQVSGVGGPACAAALDS